MILWKKLGQNLRDGSKFMGYPDRDNRQGAKTFSRKKGGADFFSKKGVETFLKKIRGAKAFLLQNLKIQDFIFQKNIFLKIKK